jgi:hypothetical protein
MNSKSVGERSEAQVLAMLLKAGKVILVPFGDNQRYDLVIDDGGKFIRVQCKTGRIKKNVLCFPTCSSTLHRKNGKKQGYKGEVELFGVYCPDNDKVYMIPVNDAPDRACSLRLKHDKNIKYANSIKWAHDYEFTGELSNGKTAGC